MADAGYPNGIYYINCPRELIDQERKKDEKNNRNHWKFA